MKSLQKENRIRLEGEEYKKFITSIFMRDVWMCRHCGSRRLLTPHHLIKRSQLGSDTPGNVLTLCMHCHDDVEQHRLEIEIADVVVRFKTKSDPSTQWESQV